jgi:flagellar basal-body rod modification protein FlgD
MAAGIASAAASGAAATSASDRTTIAENFDAFLLLLTTQLKNQNPLEPLDTNQFTQQLVQFASVEQQIKSNETLNALLTSSRSSIVSTAAGFVGMQVTADGATTRLSDGKAEWRLNVARAATAAISIRDRDGNVVATATKALTAGGQSYAWDGRTSTGQAAPAGDYTITVTGRDVAGQTVSVKTEIAGRVDSVDMSGDEPVLMIGGVQVPLKTVKSIAGAGSS